MPADAEAQPAPTLGGRDLAILLFALIATAIGQSLVFAVLAPLGREVDLSELQITSIIAISALVFALGSPRWGRFSDRAGRKPVIITGLVGYTIGTVLFTSVFWAGTGSAAEASGQNALSCWGSSAPGGASMYSTSMQMPTVSRASTWPDKGAGSSTESSETTG